MFFNNLVRLYWLLRMLLYEHMNIFIASDHAGFELKEYLREALSEIGHRVIDCGAYAFREDDDYPVFIQKAAKAVSEAEQLKAGEEDAPNYEAVPYEVIDLQHTPAHETKVSDIAETRGIVIGGSGQGEAIVANKIPHIRAALCYGGQRAEEIVKLSREHNNSNILSLGARFIEADQALELTLLWLNTEFSGDTRHVRRIHEIEEITHNPLFD